MRLAGMLLFVMAVAYGADYEGARPPKTDIPYLVHAGKLLETEVAEAKEEQKKDEITYVIAGAASPVKTPLAGPILLIQADKLSPERFELYRLEVKNGRREITINQKKKIGPRPFPLTVTRVADRLYRLEAGVSLQNGQYSISPSDSNQAFCFEIY